MSAITVKLLQKKIRELKERCDVLTRNELEALRERDVFRMKYRDLLYVRQREEKILNHIIGFHGRDPS